MDIVSSGDLATCDRALEFHSRAALDNGVRAEFLMLSRLRSQIKSNAPALAWARELMDSTYGPIENPSWHVEWSKWIARGEACCHLLLSHSE
jgi:hypothetical protein